MINIVGVDDDGNSSPYLKIKLGDKEIDVIFYINIRNLVYI